MADEVGTPRGQRPAFYAKRSGPLGDWWTLLHPPYTLWHLSYVVIGACLAPRPDAVRLVGTLLAFFLAVGVAAHVFDELAGRPLQTGIASSVLVGTGVASLCGALALGAAGLSRVGWPLVPFMALGPVLVLSYNLEWFGGVVHTDAGFAAAWGAFPVLTSYVAQTSTLASAPVIASAGAFALSAAQRALSTQARLLRRKVSRFEVAMKRFDRNEAEHLGQSFVLEPTEKALRYMSWATFLLAAGIAVARLT